MQFKHPPHTAISVWYESSLIAVILNPTDEKIETAVREHNFFTSVKLKSDFLFNCNTMEKADIDLEMEDNGEVYTGSIELTLVTVY